jgi:RNA polymerase sigma-70 factor (ECF subfamily)
MFVRGEGPLTGAPVLVANFANLSDEEVVSRVLAGDTALFEIIIRRYNQMLYRVARGILRNDHEAEDVMQETYVRAYEHLRQYAGRAQFRTWLTRIAVHEALARARRGQRFVYGRGEESGESMDTFASTERNPEQLAAGAELRTLIEGSILQLPDLYRSVFLLRDVEQLNMEEVCEILNLTEGTVKVRLHRARRALRKIIFSRTGEQLVSAFPFEAPRCDRVVARVFQRISTTPHP